jgi:cytochrome c-type biogenesis protein CcmH
MQNFFVRRPGRAEPSGPRVARPDDKLCEAKAGTHEHGARNLAPGIWIPAFAGTTRRVRRAAILLLACIALTTNAFAVQPDEVLKDPALEARARALSQTLRCMVCQNESIDESNAPLARDLRILVRERIEAGDSDAEVREFLVARYGEFILLTPQLDSRTILLWSAPVLVLLAGGIGVLATMRRRRQAQPPLSDAEKARLAALLGENKNS